MAKIPWVNWRIVGDTWSSISPYHGEIAMPDKGVCLHVSKDETGAVLTSRVSCHKRMMEVAKTYHVKLNPRESK